MNRNTLIGGKLILKNNKVSKKTKRQISSASNHLDKPNNTCNNKLIDQSLEVIEKQTFDISNPSATNEEKDLMKHYQEQIEHKTTFVTKEEEQLSSIELFNKMTPAEKLFEERRLNRLPDKIKKMTRSSFKEKYQTYYKSLTKLPEHHDIPKVGPG